jgi:hypothetical protein
MASLGDISGSFGLAPTTDEHPEAGDMPRENAVPRPSSGKCNRSARFPDARDG